MAAILAFEAVVVVGALHVIPAFHPRLLPIAIVSFAVFLGLGHPWLKAQKRNLPFSLGFLAGYLACIAAEICLSLLTSVHGNNIQFREAAAIAIAALFLLKIPLLALACAPLRVWATVLRETSPLWLYSLIAGGGAWFLLVPFQLLWTESGAASGGILQTATFYSVRAALSWFSPDAFADASSFAVGTPRFSVIILRACSGMEGMGLILAFSIIWLTYLRKQTRFPQALLLIPCALGCMWLMNVVRIAVLILLGNAAGEEVAMVGFHSQAGWIAFTAVALGFSMATQKLSWVRKVPASASFASREVASGVSETLAGAAGDVSDERGESPAIRPYLVPFLAILAASFISKAASGYFEWLYPLRFVAAAAALWYYWPELKKLNWRFGWIGPITGAAIFLVWIAPSWWAHGQSASRLGSDLAALSPMARWTWIAFRVAAAVVTVPIAEELAFRGYLARRFVSREFDTVAFNGLTAVSVGLSSVAFGLMHGQHWVVGIVAGLAYGLVLRWRGRFGDAVVAHAVSNLLLAAWVLGFGDWAQW